MANRILRAIVVLAALAAQAGAGYHVWAVEQQVSVEHRAGDDFDRQARQMILGLADLRASFQAYVADGQNASAWQKSAGDLLQAATSGATALRATARAPESQSALEETVELLGALGKTDSRARDYMASAQRLSASDVVFGEAAPQTVRAASAIDLARGQESIARATAIERLRLMQVYSLAGAVVVTLVGLLLLLPVPRAAAGQDETAGEGEGVNVGPGLGISRVSATTAPLEGVAHPPDQDWCALCDRQLAVRPSQDASFAAAADLCTALARVKEPGEFPGLLNRAAELLDAVGVIIWMPDGPAGALRPAVAHGYPPVAITRMGSIAVNADNATALAFRSRTTEVVAAEGDTGGAVVAPLVTADGCSGVMAAEFHQGVTPTDQVRALATIIAAQMATLISPASVPGEHA